MFKLTGFVTFVLMSFQLYAKEIISICYEEWSPYAYEENAKHSGDIVEWLTRDLHKQAISIEFYEYPYARCIKEVNKGKIDFSLFVDHRDDLELVEYKLVDWQLADLL